jgi:hypothetical protein
VERRLRQVREHPLFADAKAALDVDPRALDEALEGLVGALAIAPAGFWPCLPGRRTRYAFTRGTLRMSSLMVHFVVDEQAGIAELLWIEPA